ncbi:ADP-ribosylation factor-like protein 2 isoform X2 [Primulina tabacum]|uniref:ADP-ribosylation factor-like protein 2 isoform X2 n=1 Tax=Primulina tabacum TaxID=48773 RepID=UPI003F5A5403
MGLLSIIRKIKHKEKEMCILMVGLDNSRKTTIVLKINGEDTSVISPTLGFNIKTINYQKYTLIIWDVGGQKTIRSYWRNYFEQTDGLIWVVDSSDIRRLNDCKYELDNLLKEECCTTIGIRSQDAIAGMLDLINSYLWHMTVICMKKYG